MSRIIRAIAALIVILTMVALGAPQASAATPLHHEAGKRDAYVALGDSFAAGVGAAPTSNSCGRTALAYPKLIAEIGRLDLTQVACSGATMADVAANQLSALESGTDVVTVQVGGNDVGFVPVLAVCAQPDGDAQCAAAAAQSKGYLNSGFVTNAATLFAAVRAAAPGATVIVVGYPHLFGNRDCSPLTEFTAAERALLNDTTDLLNRRLGEAARLAGAKFADPTDRFEGHAWCSRTPWINGPTSPLAAFHPNALGQVLGYLPVVGRHFID